MKKSLLLFTALIFSTLVMAQRLPENTMVWSKSIPNKKKSTYNKFIGETDEGVLVTKTTLKKELAGNYAFPVLEVYDRHFTLVNSRELDAKDGRGKALYEQTVLLDGKLYLFYSRIAAMSRTVTLMVQPLNTKSLQAAGEPYIALETQMPMAVAREDVTNFEFTVSDDNASLLVSHVAPVGANKNQVIHMYVLDGRNNTDWNKSVELPYASKMFEKVSQSVDNLGNVYLLAAKYRDGNKERKNGRPNYAYVMMGYTAGGALDFTHAIAAGNRFFREMQVAVTPNSEIICTGFYSNYEIGFGWSGKPSPAVTSFSNERSNPVGGVYYLKLDMKSKTVVKESSTEFSMDFLTRNLARKDAKKAVKNSKKGKNSTAFSFNLDDLIIREDGSVTLVGEQFSNTTARTVKTVGPHAINAANHLTTGSTTKYYSYLDIIAVHLSPEGELEWAEKIAKKQNTVSDFGLFSSYAMAVEEGRLHFVFNDHPANLHYGGNGSLNNFNPRKGRKEAALAVVTLDSQGNKSRKHLSMPAGTSVFVKPETSRQLPDDQLFLFGQYKKDFRLARMDF